MSTIQDDARRLGRPMLGRASWELANMVKALGMLPWLNTADDLARLAEAKRELAIRRRGSRNLGGSDKPAHMATVLP